MNDPNDLLIVDDGTTRGDLLAYGEPDGEELAAINRLARGRLTAADVYVVDAVPSSTATDSYFTHMDDATTLANYAEDAAAGVPILNSHGRSRGMFAADLPIGRSFAGRLVREDLTTPRGIKVHATKTKPVVYSAFYLPRGMETSSASNDAIIRAIDTGVLSDVSVGFGDVPGKVRGNGYWYRCDECGQDGLRAPECTHFPGQMIVSDGGKSSHRVTWTVMDAGLKEYSPVWRGASPGAVMPARLLAKAGDLVSRGVLSQADVCELDRATGRHMADALDWSALKAGRIVMAGAGATTEPGGSATTGASTGATTGAVNGEDAQRRAVLDEALGAGTEQTAGAGTGTGTSTGTGTDAPPASAAGQTTHPLVTALAAAGITDEAALRALLATAADGRRYRADLVELCHRRGVAALGAGYQREVQERVLAHLDVADLLRTIEGYNAAVRVTFRKDTPGAADAETEAMRGALKEPIGGRQTVAGDGPLGDRQGAGARAGGATDAAGSRLSGGIYSTRRGSRAKGR